MFTVQSSDGIDEYPTLDAIQSEIEGIDFLESSARVFDEGGIEYVPLWIERPARGLLSVTIGEYRLIKAPVESNQQEFSHSTTDAQQGGQLDAASRRQLP